MDSNKEMQYLMTSVYTPMIFYFPSGLLDNMALKVTDEMRTHPLFNTLFITLVNDDAAAYDVEKHALVIYEKEQIFNANIFKLFEIKGRNNEDAFKYLIEKYISQVRAYHDAFVILVEHVEEYIVNVSKVTISSLEYQMNITAIHLAELEKRFAGYDAIASESIESILTSTKMFKINSDNLTTEEKKSEVVSDKKDSNKQKPQKRKKLVLATDEEVDDYLIKTFFNVKTTKSTTK